LFSSSSDDDFEDAEEPEEKKSASTVKFKEQSLSAPPRPTSFFTPVKSQSKEQDAFARVRQKIVAVTARKWRDENIRLKQQVEELVADNEQLESEGNDLMLALESAQTVEHELEILKLTVAEERKESGRVFSVPCTDCDRRRNQMRELLVNLNETAEDLGLRLQSLKSSAGTSLMDKH
jgi:hypothetical protein